MNIHYRRYYLLYCSLRCPCIVSPCSQYRRLRPGPNFASRPPAGQQRRCLQSPSVRARAFPHSSFRRRAADARDEKWIIWSRARGTGVLARGANDIWISRPARAGASSTLMDRGCVRRTPGAAAASPSGPVVIRV